MLNVDEDPADANKPKTTYKGGAGLAGIRAGGEDDGMGGEDSASCSCLFGNPCVSAYNCKNWHNRFEVAKVRPWDSTNKPLALCPSLRGARSNAGLAGEWLEGLLVMARHVCMLVCMNF